MLFVKPGFTNFMPPGLSSVHCPNFHGVGQVCTGVCLKKHVPPRAWTRVEKEQLIEHVDRNQDNIRFLGIFSRFLPDAEKHLLKLGENGRN